MSRLGAEAEEGIRNRQMEVTRDYEPTVNGKHRKLNVKPDMNDTVALRQR